MPKICAQCGCECSDEYYKALDNYLQTHYFDDDDTNCFCSKECFCDFVMLETFYEEEGEEDA